jgi:hypothetical protein
MITVVITAHGEGASEASSTQTFEYDTLDDLMERVNEHFRKDVPNLRRAIPKPDASHGEPISLVDMRAYEKARTEGEARVGLGRRLRGRG